MAFRQFNSEFVRRRRKRALEMLLACVAALIPWTIFLAISLPNQYDAHHWRLTWAGFDGLLLIAMSMTVYLGWRRRQAVIVAAIATAVLLICDAWFDITLDLGTPEVWWSLASAVLVELPLAGFFITRAFIIISITVRRAYEEFGIDAPPPSVLRLPLFGISRELDRD